MIMKTVFYLLSLSLISFAAMGQGVDLSGTWNLNKSKSILNKEYSMAPEQLILIQRADTLSVERHSNFQGRSFTFTDTFTLDGKECINPVWENFKKKSTAIWSDDKNWLTISTKIPMQGGGEMSINEIYQLAENSLKITTSASSSFGDLNETYLFDKP
jgi:hypothetical protein